jgi:two-component system, LytTR family, sensor kinase
MNAVLKMEKIEGYKGEILVVDDDPANLDLLTGMLEAQGYDVRVVNSGQLALATLKTSLPDLVLLDINYEVCRQIKADPNSSDLPVIFISANDDTLNKVDAFLAGGVDYVTKPFHLEEVIVRIESQLKISRLSQELQMQMLRYQLNPHFLFNALISIRALIPTNSDAAEEMVTQLSDYLRYLLSSRNNLEITVREEMEAAENYLAIEKIRFKEKLNVDIDIEPTIGENQMPAFLIQPLLENAVKYGMRTSSKPVEIKLTAQLKDDTLCFTVSNTGRWFNQAENDIPEGASLGVGLRNVRQRLRQKYPSSHSFNIDESNGKVNVTIEIPLLWNENAASITRFDSRR